MPRKMPNLDTVLVNFHSMEEYVSELNSKPKSWMVELTEEYDREVIFLPISEVPKININRVKKCVIVPKWLWDKKLKEINK